MSFWIKSSKLTFKYIGQPNVIFRYLRNSRRSGEPKLLKGSIKTLTEHNPKEQFSIENFQEFVKKVKSSAHVDDYAIEEALNSGDDFGSAIGEAAKPDPDEIMEDKSYKSFIKKKIIGQKYFKFEKETNLLTHAAKEQIRYLHRMDPEQWNTDTLAQSFPISVSGVKKMLKNNFVPRSPEKIKQHDTEVIKRWELLESRTLSPLITPITQRMWNEGKITKVNYNGNPNLPNVPPVIKQTVIYTEEKEIGEYSAIVQQYIEYKKNKEKPPENTTSISDELQVKDVYANTTAHKMQKGYDGLNRKRYHVDDETVEEDHSKSTITSARRKQVNDAELLHSQFQDNLREEVKQKSDPRYAEWMEQQYTSKTTKTPAKPVDAKNFFSKISKLKKETVEFNRDMSKEGEVVYYYDENYGYQYPKGRVVPSKIPLTNKQRNKGSLYKVGQSVYDADGEFLYKVPK